jgi:hypothetical protein
MAAKVKSQNEASQTEAALSSPESTPSVPPVMKPERRPTAFM